MTKKKSAKHALLMSVLSLIVCVSMLVGSTFAWFTDTVTSGNNKIQAGTLKVDLELLEKDGSWTSIKDSSEAIFDYENWEPGYTDVKIFKVVNEGTLALKWYAKFSSTSALSDLAKVIDVYVCPSETTELTYPADRNLDGYTKVGTLDQFINTISNTTNGTLLAKGAENNGDVAYLGIALKMQEEADNEYQGMDLGGAFDIQIFATQYTHESDSFDNQYDKGASWTGTVNTDWYNTTATEFVLTSADELAGFAQLVNSSTDTFSGKTVKLGANIDLNNIAWTPIGSSADGWNSKFNGTFIGTGYTISNLYVTGTKGLGLFGYVGNAAHIEGVTIDGAYVAGNDYVGAVMGTGYLAANCLKNCTVMNAEIIAMPYLLDDGVTYDGGAKAGAVAGYAINGDISGNKAINCSVTAYRDLGGIVGMAAGEDRNITVSDNSVENLTLTYVSAMPYADNKVNENMGSIVGRYDESKVTVADNTETNVERKTVVEYTLNNITYIKDVDAGEVTLYKVNEDYASDTVNVPEGVTNIGAWSFAYNSNVKNVKFASTVKSITKNAFKDSAVESIELNEGLAVIDDYAFNSAKSLSSIKFSSTITTVGERAFQATAITELDIPANVIDIQYAAFVSMPNLTNVTIRGNNVNIDSYAFRACPKLAKITILAEDVTIGNNMPFTNAESNNPGTNSFTFFVKNQTVADKITTAMGTGSGYEIVIASLVSNDDEKAAEGLANTLANGGNAVLTEDLTFSASDTTANSGYGATGVAVNNGGTLDGNGNTLTVTNANTTWDCAVNVKNGTLKNITIKGATRGIFMGSADGDVYIDNVILDDVIYTFNSDGGNKDYGVYISNSVLNGWTSFSNAHKEVVFTNCQFGEGNGYAFCRPYNAVVFENCVFEEGFEFDATKVADIVFKNCYYGDTLITAENAATLASGDVVFFYNGVGSVSFQ